MPFLEKMRYFLAFFILFGLWTSYQNSKHRTILRFYSLFQISLIVLEFLFGILYDIFYENVTLSNAVANLLFLLIISTHFVVVVESITQNQAQEKLIQELSSIDNLISTNFGIQNLFRKEICAIFAQISILLFIKSTIIISNLSIQLYINRLYNYFFVTMYSDFIIYLRSIQILNFVYLLNCGLHSIYTILRQIEMTQNDFVQKESTSKFENSFATLSTYDQLLCLKVTYGKLHDICEQINNIFGWSLLMIFTETFIHFTLNCYWSFIYLTMSDEEIYAIIINVTISTRDVIMLCGIAFYCSSCSKYVKID